jgi:hypothetical protein
VLGVKAEHAARDVSQSKRSVACAPRAQQLGVRVRSQCRHTLHTCEHVATDSRVAEGGQHALKVVLGGVVYGSEDGAEALRLSCYELDGGG